MKTQIWIEKESRKNQNNRNYKYLRAITTIDGIKTKVIIGKSYEKQKPKSLCKLPLFFANS